ncbi:hypothetical protein CDAR_437151 [Caerostris darwini]|uniref:Uncharacterized protein n=1 Tax=Caerostris darwini TaxID=1538125 RepID=A0AAV4TV55_9ARAC|nr:hypothetical protein CDAR_437151 [Caerostris darwini]
MFLIHTSIPLYCDQDPSELINTITATTTIIGFFKAWEIGIEEIRKKTHMVCFLKYLQLNLFSEFKKLSICLPGLKPPGVGNLLVEPDTFDTRSGLAVVVVVVVVLIVVFFLFVSCLAARATEPSRRNRSSPRMVGEATPTLADTCGIVCYIGCWSTPSSSPPAQRMRQTTGDSRGRTVEVK